MIFYGNAMRNIQNNQYQKADGESFLSKIKSFIKQHPYIFSGIVGGFIVIVVVVIVLCVVLTKEEKTNEEEEIVGNPIFPLEESSKLEVMEIYNNIGNNDKSTLNVFHEYLSQKSSNLKDEQKVYLAYYWITKNIIYDYDGLNNDNAVISPAEVFPKRKTVCSGYAILFKDLLLSMNYPESKILYISGYAKGAGYSPYIEPTSNHAWNAVEINGKWCLIDTTWDAPYDDEYYLCTPPKCFVRDHLPERNNSLQFLKEPISLETFHGLIETYREKFCKNYLEIIEDKAIQNICGNGKIIIKYNEKFKDAETSLDFVPYSLPLGVSYFINRINNGFEINLSVNKAGTFVYHLLFNSNMMGTINFQCNEEPIEKFYYPTIYSTYSESDAQLISPMERYLIRGKKYNFEIRTNDFEKLTIIMGREKIPMDKQGNIFKKEIEIHGESDDVVIYSTDVDCLLLYEIIDE